MSVPNIWDGTTPVDQVIWPDPEYAPNHRPLHAGAVPVPAEWKPTRRERFVLEALRAIGANGFTGTTGELAEEAVRLADKLLAKLDKPRG